MALKTATYLIVILFVLACKKSEDRRCWKTVGDESSLVVPIDSIQKMTLNSGLTYVMHQSNDRKVEIIGGENMVNLVAIDINDYNLEVTNKSFCDFLRDANRKVTVHIYYPRFSDVYAEVSDSLIFDDIIQGDLLKLEMREAGGVTYINANVNDLRVVVSAGPGSFVLDGSAKFADIRTQGQGFGDATGLSAQNLFAYQNSRSPLKLNLGQTNAEVLIDGAGDVLHLGEPNSLKLTQNGAGNFIKL